MATKTIKAILRLRGGTLIQWQNNNTVLLERQIGMITQGPEYGKFKVGDGVTAWNDLPYVLGADGTAATIGISGVDTVDYNIPANVTNEGTQNAALLRFTIPRGYPGSVVPDITGLLEAGEINPSDLMYIYDTGAATLKKAAVAEFLSFFESWYPIGCGYIQYPNDPAPSERNYPGAWELWNARADLYRLSDDPPPSFTVYTEGANYAANDCVMYHLDGDDYRLYTAKAAITGAAEQLDPVLWDRLDQGTIVERRLVQAWTDNDLAAGDQIAGGAYDGQYVTEVIVPGGKFFGAEGGNRPPFISGGAQGDRIRNIVGAFNANNSAGFIGDRKLFVATGAAVVWVGGSQYLANNTIYFNTGMIVPVGPDNAPSNLSVRFWRRIS
ncbi:MAG: hypothetical protein LBJ31_11960 [Treponema sp.]|jgi:hypothetical protein|nr:hypothetical protein [Treponema sp.]